MAEHDGPPWAITSRDRMVKRAKELVADYTDTGASCSVTYIAGVAELIVKCFPEHAGLVVTAAEICNLSATCCTNSRVEVPPEVDFVENKCDDPDCLLSSDVSSDPTNARPPEPIGHSTLGLMEILSRVKSAGKCL